MPKISRLEFDRVPLRVHEFLAGVPLHDAWAIDLPRTRSGITLDEFVRTKSACFSCPPLVRALLSIRLFVGRLFGWDRELAATASQTFATRLTTADRSKSVVPVGTREGFFRVVYRFENEQLLELSNRTAHAAAMSAVVETGNAYRFYSLHARLYGPDRPTSQASDLSINLAQRPRELGPSLRLGLTTERAWFYGRTQFSICQIKS